MAYNCINCKREFGSQQALRHHLDSLAHAFDCEDCDRTFGSQQALRQHLDSPAHAFDCEDCDRNFGSQQALQQHLDSPAHTTKNNNAYLGIHRSIVDPVYATAVRLRFEQPTVNDIRRKTGTELDEMIVSSLIGAARRLLPIDNTPQGNALRIEQHRIKLADSKRAEDTFCAELDRLGYVFLREAQQEGEAVTPDVRFIKPTNVCGHLCMWLEYKNYSDSDQIHMWHQPAKVNTRSMGLR